MEKLKALRAKRGEIVDAMSALTEAEEFDQAAFDAKKADLDKIDRQIAAAEEAQRLQAATAKPSRANERTPAQPRRFRSGSLRAFRGETAEEDAYRSGQFIRSVLLRHDAATQWCRDNGVVVTRAQSEDVNTAGGFLVIPEFERAIIDLREMYGMFRQECRLMPMGSDQVLIPRRTGGVTAYWVNENAEITASDKSWGQVQLLAKKLAALTRLSTELADDAIISIADDLADEMAYAFAKEEDRVGWNGTGLSTDGGIMGARPKIVDGTHTASAIVAAAGHDTFAEIDAADLASVMAALPKYAEMTAKWYCSQYAWAQVFQRLAQASGGTTMTEVTGGKPRRAYLGYEVAIDQTLPSGTGDFSNLSMLFFGDLRRAARMGERRGFTIARSEDRYFEFDQIGVKATERVDINVHDLGDNATAGPLIALVGAP